MTVTATRQRADITEGTVPQIRRDRLKLATMLIDNDVRRHPLRAGNHLSNPRNAASTLHQFIAQPKPITRHPANSRAVARAAGWIVQSTELPCHRDTLARRAAERGVYAERAQLIALIAAHYRAELFKDPNEPVRADVVYVDTPAGQLSWHLAATDVAAYFTSIKRAQPHQAQPWDGHSNEEKCRRIHELTQRLAGARAITHPDRLGTPNRHRPPRSSSTGLLYRETRLLNSTDWEHITEALNWLAVCVEEDPKGWPELSPEAIEATWNKTVVQLPATSRLLPQPPPSAKTSHQ